MLTGLAAASLIPSIGSGRAAPDYPAGVGTIKVIVPFAPGGASDIVARLLADHFDKKWNVTAIVQNVPGASATVGIGQVAKGPVDGSEIIILGINFITTQFIMKSLPYDPELDITPLTQLTRQANLLCVRKDLPVNSVAELVAYAKANPGKLNYASSGLGSPMHLSAELFKKMTGVGMTHVPYSGSAPAQAGLASGDVDLAFDNVAAIIGLARGGGVKPLAITSPERSKLAPEFPAVAETIPGYAIEGWLGAGVRAGTPKPVCDAIQDAAVEIFKDTATRERLKKILSEPVGSDSVAFTAFLAAERARWGALIKSLDLKT